MKFTFSKVIVGVFLVLGPVKAMIDSQEEETSKFPQVKTAQQRTEQKETPSLTPYKEDSTFEVLPDELLLTIFRFLDVDNLGRVAQVSTRWRRIIKTPDLWKYITSRYYGEYLSQEDLRENTKEKVVYHYLSVIVNATENLKEIERLVSKYNLIYINHFLRAL